MVINLSQGLCAIGRTALVAVDILSVSIAPALLRRARDAD
jgi:hypothetical protein